MVALTVSLVLLSQTPDALLGGPGESCRARADCQSGLKCLNAVCTVPIPITKEGQACEATSECSTDGSLRCIARVCSRPGTRPAAVVAQATPAPAPAPSQGWSAAPPPPQPTAYQPAYPPPPSSRGPVQTADELIAQAIEAEVRPFEKNAFFIGGALHGGVVNGVAPSVGPDLRFGWFFKRTQLSFELGLQYYPSSAEASVSGRASVGFSVPFVERGDFAFFWGPKAGVSLLAGALTALGVHADLVSFGIRTGHWLVDLQLPSVGLVFGGGAAYVPVQARLTVAYTF
jgi:hypothetical protein